MYTSRMLFGVLTSANPVSLPLMSDTASTCIPCATVSGHAPAAVPAIAAAKLALSTAMRRQGITQSDASMRERGESCERLAVDTKSPACTLLIDGVRDTVASRLSHEDVCQDSA